MADGGRVPQADQVLPVLDPARPERRAPGGWRLPAGRELAAGDFAWRHRFVCLLVAVHVPALLLLGLLPVGSHDGTRDTHVGHLLLELLPIAVLLAVAVRAPVSRRWRACAATTALLTCSAVLVHLFDGTTEAHFHYFVAVAVIALYQDWSAYALAVGFVLLQHGLTGAALEHDGQRWGWALVHAGFVLAESAVLVVFWHANEAARAEHDRLTAEQDRLQAEQDRLQAEQDRLQAEQDGLRAEAAQLHEVLVHGQSSVQARLAETDRIRTDLIGTVSHEFRTPLTSIRGTALTLLKRGERLDEPMRQQLLHGLLAQQERLSRLLENMLTAAQATATDPSACTEVDAVAAEVAMLAGATRPSDPPVSVLVEPGTVARIDRQALHQVLANLVDNAQQHGAPGAVPILAAGRDERTVWLTVSNEGTTLTQEQSRDLFQPFTQAESGVTRGAEGLGMGLYVVKRLVEVYGGSVDLRSEGGWTTVELQLAAGLSSVPAGRVAV